MTLSEIQIPKYDIPVVTLQGVTWVANAEGADGGGHEHDYIGNWLWDDGSCILWDDGSVMAL